MVTLANVHVRDAVELGQHHRRWSQPPPKRRLGNNEFQVLRVIVKNGLAIQPGSDGCGDVWPAARVPGQHQAAGVVGGLQEPGEDRGLEVEDGGRGSLQLANVLLQFGQPAAGGFAP